MPPVELGGTVHVGLRGGDLPLGLAADATVRRVEALLLGLDLRGHRGAGVLAAGLDLSRGLAQGDVLRDEGVVPRVADGVALGPDDLGLAAIGLGPQPGGFVLGEGDGLLGRVVPSGSRVVEGRKRGRELGLQLRGEGGVHRGDELRGQGLGRRGRAFEDRGGQHGGAPRAWPAPGGGRSVQPQRLLGRGTLGGPWTTDREFHASGTVSGMVPVASRTFPARKSASAAGATWNRCGAVTGQRRISLDNAE